MGCNTTQINPVVGLIRTRILLNINAYKKDDFSYKSRNGMFPRANELNMVSDNGVSNSKDLKGAFNQDYGLNKLPEYTILYGQKYK